MTTRIPHARSCFKNRPNDAEVTNGDTDNTKGNHVHNSHCSEEPLVMDMVGHDSQMRYRSSFLSVNIHVCIGAHECRPKETGQPVVKGMRLRSTQRAATQATRQTSEPELKSAGAHALETLCTEVVNVVTVEGSEPGRRAHCRRDDRREERTSAGGAATEGTQVEEGAELAREIDEIAPQCPMTIPGDNL